MSVLAVLARCRWFRGREREAQGADGGWDSRMPLVLPGTPEVRHSLIFTKTLKIEGFSTGERDFLSSWIHPCTMYITYFWNELTIVPKTAGITYVWAKNSLLSETIRKAEIRAITSLCTKYIFFECVECVDWNVPIYVHVIVPYIV